jgi:hypothetical protein
MASPASSVGSYEPFPSSSSESEGRSLDEFHDLLAPEYWDERDWDFLAWSEDDESLIDDEDLDVLLGEDLPDDDLSDCSWEGDEDEASEDSEGSNDSNEDPLEHLLRDEEEDESWRTSSARTTPSMENVPAPDAKASGATPTMTTVAMAATAAVTTAMATAAAMMP